MIRPYVVWPLRFSPNAPAMIDFYTRLGLHKSVSHDNGTFATFRGRSGTLGVHDAHHTESGVVPQHTALNFATDDVEKAAEELTAMGHVVKFWDETYGKQGVVASRDGRVIGLNEDSQEDLYGGYRAHAADRVPTLDVVAVSVSPEMRAEAAWFASFGFVAPSYDDPWWIGLRAGDRSGVIGIHAGEVDSERVRAAADDLFGPAYEVRLGFETHEPLDVLEARLRESGFETTLVTDDAPHLELTDPDGEQIEIHVAPAASSEGA